MEDLAVLEDNEWDDVSMLDLAKIWWANYKKPRKRGLEELPPKIGHTEAWEYPDMTHVTWKYAPKGAHDEVRHDNTERSLRAASVIHAELCKFSGSRKRGSRGLWDSIDALFHSPELNIDKRCAAWKRTFGKMFEPPTCSTTSMPGGKRR